MKIERIFIEQFGKHQGLELSFGPNFNLLWGPNESGKSTVLTFILSALYGLDTYSGKKDLQRNERSRYRPWSGQAYGGYLEVEKDGRHYRIERSFGDTKGKDKTSFFNLTTGESIALAKDEEPGAYLMGLDRDEFKNSVYMGQLSMAMESNDAIRAKLMEQSAGVGLGSSVADLEAVLNTRRAELTRPRSKALLEQSQDLILELEKEEAEAYETADLAKEARAQLGAKQDRLVQVREELSHLDKQKQRAQALERRKAYRNLLAQQDRVKDLENQVKAAVSTLGYDHPDQIPDREERDLAVAFVRKIQDYDRKTEALEKDMAELGQRIESLGSAEFLAAEEKRGLEGLEELKEERRIKQKQKDDLAQLELAGQKSRADQDRAVYEAQDALEKDQADLKELDRVHDLVSDKDKRVRQETETLEKQAAELAELEDGLGRAEGQREAAEKEKEVLEHKLAGGQKKAMVKLGGGLAFLAAAIALFLIPSRQSLVLILAVAFALAGLVFMGLAVAAFNKKTALARDLDSLGKKEAQSLGKSQELAMRLKLSRDQLDSRMRSLEENKKDLNFLRKDLMDRLPEGKNYAAYREDLAKKITQAEENLTRLRQKGRADQAQSAALIKEGQDKLEQMRPDELMDEEEMVLRENIRHIQKKSDLLKALEKDLEDDKKALDQSLSNRSRSMEEPPALVGLLLDGFSMERQDMSGDLLEEALNDFLKQIASLENRMILLEEGNKTLLRAQGDLSMEAWADRDLADAALLEQGDNQTEKMAEGLDRDAEDLEAESQALRAEEAELHGQIGRLSSRLENLLKETRVLQQIQEDLDLARADFTSYKTEIEDIDLAKAILDEVDRRMQGSFGPAINKKAGEILAYMTGDDRADVLIDREFRASVEDPLTRQMKELEYYSGGKIDQVYMAMRLAIALSLYQDEDGHKLPFIFDDSLIQYDKDRASRALAYLVKLAEEEDRQIIFATCHRAYGEMLEARDGETLKKIHLS